ncbi:MAG: hypothetical protein KBT45_07990 [Bacteroidales bacterium]|nr:hypothetical protein [Candidatus Colimorpha pelethequi]MCQ2262608.1 hypothetical protein [Bacteroidales bacterium]
MAKIFGINTKISGKVGQLLYRQTKKGTVVSELPTKPAIPRRSANQMDQRTQWANLSAIYKQFGNMLRHGFEDVPDHMSSFNAFLQANLGVVKVFITKSVRLNGGAILAPYQITRGSLPSIGMGLNAGNLLVSTIKLGACTIDANTTIGDFSQAILSYNDSFQEGDQLTFFHGIQSIDVVTSIPRAAIKGYKVIINTADETKLWDVVDPIGFSTVDTCLGTASRIVDGAAAWVHSREDANGGLRVSTQFFYVENAALASYQSHAAFSAAVNSYGGINMEPVYLKPELSMNTL